MPSETLIIALAGLGLGLGAGFLLARARAGAAGEAQRRFASISDEIKDMVFRYDMSGGGRFEFINTAAVDVTGYHAKELMGNPELLYRIAVHDEEFDPHSLKAMLIQGARKNPTFAITRKDGQRSWVKMRNVLIREGAAGRVRAVEGIISDVTRERQARESLRDSAETYRIFFSASGLATAMVDEEGRVPRANDAFAAFCAADLERVQGKARFDEFLDESSAAKFKRYNALAMVQPDVVPRGFGADFQDRKGAIKPVYIFMCPVPEKRVSVLTVLDLPELRLMQEAADVQRLYFRQLFHNSPLGIAILDEEGRVMDINPGYTAMFGYALEDVRKWQSRHFLVPKDLLEEGGAIHQSVLAGKTVQRETRRTARNGREIPVQFQAYPFYLEDEIGGIFAIYQDISQRKEYEEQLAHSALHDPLTGLPNRALFKEYVHKAMHRGDHADTECGVVMLDLDRFRRVNETYGHEAGDAILREVAARLAELASPEDSLARLTGDQFGILLDGMESRWNLLAKVTEIGRSLNSAYRVGDAEVHVECAQGIVMDIHTRAGAEEVLRDAAVALDRAKLEGGEDRLKVFREEMFQEVADAVSLENEIRRAIRGKQFRVHYQPVISLQDERVVGFEALLRWIHPERGEISPEEFIPVAESTGLINRLGAFVLRAACAQMARWHREVPEARGLVVSLNISPRQLEEQRMAALIDRVLRESGLPPECLNIEITESLIMRDTKAAMRFFEGMRGKGVRMAIDDFGTGYSSLGYLRRFPVDSLKVDRSFVSGEASAGGRQIIKTIVDLARNMDFRIIAEGAETREQVDMLKELGCHQAQGFYFAKPMEPSEALAYFKGEG
ncbi:sensor domain-containing protein [Desulfohalovibrio reitneri]|uniref:sensor domain-containing protein n=1 Tax=Desulfohalovibrio reitneri TaxID=1307759 RepID=UPI0006902AC4|nr:EAL domain-containing protein [Desulfohalovibrio reitneri]